MTFHSVINVRACKLIAIPTKCCSRYHCITGGSAIGVLLLFNYAVPIFFNSNPENVTMIRKQRLRNITTLCETGHAVEVTKTELQSDIALSNSNDDMLRYVVTPAVDEISSSKEDVFLAINVFSAVANYGQRKAIRRTWGNTSQFGVAVKIVFLMGLSQEHTSSLRAEIDRHGDILQGNFVDTYKNLTYKSAMGLRWVSESERYQKSKFVLKVDDDVFVNMFQLIKYLESVSSTSSPQPVERSLRCHIYPGSHPRRKPTHRYHVSKREFAGESYPPFCAGVAYLMTPEVAIALYCASRYVPFLWLEDVYFTGLVAQKIGLRHENMASMYMTLSRVQHWKTLIKFELFQTTVFTHSVNFEAMLAMWNALLQHRD